jgi:putative tryptophan/tyrosine transport system substrate-binding protein
MRRREFIALLSGAAISWPLRARGQQSKLPTVGILVRAVPGSEEFSHLFPEALRDLGYIDGKNVHFEFRSDEGQITRLSDLATDLVRLKVDVIVPWLTPAAAAAKQATREIPIVCAACGDPVGSGLVESLARPGGNVTGISGVAGELAAKVVELIPEVVPSAHRIGVLANVPDPFTISFLKQVRLAGQATGTSIEPVMIRTPDELDAAFAVMEKSPPDAIIVQPSLPTKRAAELALTYRIPAFCAWRPFPHDGGLAAYVAAETEMYRRAAALVDKVLKGERPAELPVEQPTKFDLIVNLKTGKTLGLNISPSLLARADEVIE